MADMIRRGWAVLVLATAACAGPGTAEDPDSGAVADAFVAPTEESSAECSDAVDNDLDGRSDCDDVACTAFVFCSANPDAGVLRDAGLSDAGLALDGGRDGGAAEWDAGPGPSSDAGWDGGSIVVDGGGDAEDGGVVSLTDAGGDAGALPIDGGRPPETGDVLCDNRSDDDGDGAIDCDDTNCTSAAVCAPNPRPLDTPDFLIVAVSGHCNPGSCGTSHNVEYLGTRDGTVPAIASPLIGAGARVDGLYISDNFYDEPGVPPAYGFLSLLGGLRWARDSLVADWDNPTRIIVVAHSHGTVWAHTALHVLEQEGDPIPVDILIDLDAVSWGWDGKVLFGFGDAWANVIYDYTVTTATVWPFGVWNAVDSWSLPGVATRQDIEDVVPDSALYNLEVWSSGSTAFVPPDRDVNYRLDGSDTNVFTVLSTGGHNYVVMPGSDSIVWVTAQVRAIYGL